MLLLRASVRAFMAWMWLVWGWAEARDLLRSKTTGSVLAADGRADSHRGKGPASSPWSTRYLPARSRASLLTEGPRGEEGSIGEWVMILVMAVGITLFIWSIAQPLLGSILRNALGKLFR